MPSDLDGTRVQRRRTANETPTWGWAVFEIPTTPVGNLGAVGSKTSGSDRARSASQHLDRPRQPGAGVARARRRVPGCPPAVEDAGYLPSPSFWAKASVATGKETSSSAVVLHRGRSSSFLGADPIAWSPLDRPGRGLACQARGDLPRAVEVRAGVNQSGNTAGGGDQPSRVDAPTS